MNSWPTHDSRLQRLVQLAAKAWKMSGELCGPKVATTHDLVNLYGVLKRVECWGTQNCTDDTREEVEMLLDTCEKVLSQTVSFLKAYQTMGEHEERLFGKIHLQFGSFSDRQTEILDDLRKQFTHHAERFSYILILASKKLVGKRYQLKDVKDALGFAVDGLTARMMARGEFRLSMLARYPDNEAALWAECQYGLSERGFSNDFLTSHREAVLAYVRTLDQSSAYAGRIDALLRQECESLAMIQICDTDG